MLRNKNLTLFFEFFDHEHLGKDPFMVPYYLGQMLGCSVTIIYPLSEHNKDLPSEVKGVRLLPLPLYGTELSHKTIRYYAFFKYLWRHAREIDVFMRFFYADSLISFYKFLNPQGKVYIKMDVNPMNIGLEDERRRSFIYNWMKEIKNRYFINRVDVISCETSLAYERLKESKDSQNNWGDKLVLLPNGFDEELLQSSGLKEKVFAEKENLMITVGRLGTPPKNTNMFLHALAKVNLDDWKCYLIGPVAPELQSEINKFYLKNPDKKESVVFTGPIYDKKELWEYYNRSKLFVLTSKWEGYALVFTEAQRFGNYILSTHVGAIDDVIQGGKYGMLVEQGDSDMLARKIEKIINGENDITCAYDNFDKSKLSWSSRLKIIAERLKEK